MLHGTIPFAAGLMLLSAAPAIAQADQGANAAPPKAETVKPPGEHNHADMAAPKTPQLLAGYGDGGFAITRKTPEAQAFFSNGLELNAAFAHRAASEAMKEAVRLDPKCAMCLWGQALVDGPTLNYGKDAKEREPLYRTVLQARALARANGTERERALIDALATRYKPGRSIERRNRDYAEAMGKLAERYPLDNEVAVLYADAVLEATARRGEKLSGQRAVAILETVLARAPNHTPAIHFYIHAAEFAGESGKAERFADRLGALAPHASHLVHMPSHTWYWLGRYQDAADANVHAVELGKANARRLGLAEPSGVWDLPYHAHNVIFGLGGAMMAGDPRTALMLGRPLVEQSQNSGEAHPVMQLLAASGYFALARFDDPQGVLALKEPKLPYLKAAWHYARGEAFAFLRDAAAVKAEAAAIPDKIPPPPQQSKQADDDSSPAPDQMLGIVRAVLTGRAAMMEGRYADAAKAFTEAAVIEETEDFSVFSDPPAFWYPVRRDVAAALLAAGDREGARAAIEASIKLRPRDPAALELLERIGAAGQSKR